MHLDFDVLCSMANGKSNINFYLIRYAQHFGDQISIILPSYPILSVILFIYIIICTRI